MNLKTLSIKVLREDIKGNKDIAVQLYEHSKNLIEEVDPTLRAFVSYTFDKAKDSLVPVKGDLYGIPASIKDNYNWVGTHTTASSNILKNYQSPYNATVTVRLLEAGAMLMGKTNMDAFAHGSSTETSDFFITKNPHNMEHVPGGSSGGSAAAVAAGLCVYSIGSETAGSVRGPAAWCGVVGFTPTYGRISRYGLIAMGSSLDRPGVFTTNIEDAAVLLKILSGKDPKDATSLDEPALDLTGKLSSQIKGLRIGVPKQYFDDRINKEVTEAVVDALREYEKAGAILVDMDLLDPKYAVAVYTVVCRSEVSSNLARIDGIRYGHYADQEAESILEQISYNRGEGFGNEAKQRSMTGAYTLSAGYYDAYYKKAQKVRTMIIQDFHQAFDKVDVIVGPTMPTTAPKIGVTNNNPIFGELADQLTEASALAGLPCISIPIGKDHNNLPIGMQIVAKQKDELNVLNTAYAYETIINGFEI